MKLIVGLGNPGAKYAATRHNTGWLALDHYLLHGHSGETKKSEFKLRKRLHAETVELSMVKEKIILAKPTTFMNRSGDSVAVLSSFYKIQPTDILVMHDELDLPFGSLRVKTGGGDAGNKGIRSIIQTIGPAFWRLRLGIGNEFQARQTGEDFVLTNFMKMETEHLPAIFKTSDDLITRFISSELTQGTYTIDR